MPSLGDLAVSFSADLSKLTGGISEAKGMIGSVAETAASTSTSFLGHIGNMAGGILDFGAKLGQTVFGLQGLVSGVEGFGQTLLGGNADMEQTDVAFTKLLGSSKAAGDYMQQLQQFAAATPFEFPELAKDAELMKAFQFQTKDILPDLTNIGDAISGLGGGQAQIDQVVRVFGQMHSTTHLMTGDIMQLTSVGINGFQILADQMHKPVATIKDMVTAGLIPANDGINMLMKGMHETFGGGMQAQSMTFNGLLSTFDDNIHAALRSFTGPLFDEAKDALLQLGNLVSSPAFQQFATTLGKDVGGAIQHVAGFVTSSIVPAFRNLGGVVQAVLAYLNSDAFAGVVADFQTLSNQIMNMVVPAIQQLGPLFQQALSAIGPLLTGVIIPAIDTFVFNLGQLLMFLPQNQTALDALKAVGIGVAAVIGTIMVASFTAWAVAAGAAAIATIAATWPLLLIGAVVAGTAFLIISNWSKIAPAITPALSAIGKVLEQIGGYLASVFRPVWDQLVKLWTGQLLPLFKQLWNALTPLAPLLEAIGGIIAAVVVVALGLLVGVISAVIQGLAGFLGGVVTIIGGIVQVFTGVVQIVSGIIRVIVDLCTGNFSDLGAALGEIWQGIVNMFQGVWAVIKGIFQAAWGAISGLVVGFVTGIVGFFQGLYNVLVGHSIIPDMINGIISWFASLPGRAMGAVQSLARGLAGFFGGLASQALQWGANIISNVLSGIQNAAAGIGNFLGNIGTTIAHTLHIPGFATGVQNFAGGLATINEEGPEMVYLPSGSSVYTASQTQAMLSGGGGGEIHVHTHIYMDGKEITGQVMTRAMKEIRRNGGKAA